MEDAEGRREEMDQQAYRTSVERTVADVRELLQTTSSWVGELKSQDEDTKVRRRAVLISYIRFWRIMYSYARTYYKSKKTLQL